MTVFLRLLVLPPLLFVMGVILLIFVGCCAAAFWEWLRSR